MEDGVEGLLEKQESVYIHRRRIKDGMEVFRVLKVSNIDFRRLLEGYRWYTRNELAPLFLDAVKDRLFTTGVGSCVEQSPMSSAMSLLRFALPLSCMVGVRCETLGLQRDDVVAEWKRVKEGMCMNIHCRVGGPNVLADLSAKFIYHIFIKELPLGKKRKDTIGIAFTDETCDEPKIRMNKVNAQGSSPSAPNVPMGLRCFDHW
ncbi:hypothetical protein GIB67_042215 [Kingdonia uniflora]|uniref:Staygreen protein domain-containing protein n=1 Tax=Kingdonia uniflora TaxID=39325 RepID=A0A7J7LE31_9MAGN|nr:hypothetical protein GIB67_042215 [Kingdonia uniflora]